MESGNGNKAGSDKDSVSGADGGYGNETGFLGCEGKITYTHMIERHSKHVQLLLL